MHLMLRPLQALANGGVRVSIEMMISIEMMGGSVVPVTQYGWENCKGSNASQTYKNVNDRG